MQGMNKLITNRYKEDDEEPLTSLQMPTDEEDNYFSYGDGRMSQASLIASQNPSFIEYRYKALGSAASGFTDPSILGSETSRLYRTPSHVSRAE